MIALVDAMAQKYGVLPTEILHRGSTADIHIHVLAETYRERERNKKSGDVSKMAENYSRAEINEVYEGWQNSRSATRRSRRT